MRKKHINLVGLTDNRFWSGKYLMHLPILLSIALFKIGVQVALKAKYTLKKGYPSAICTHPCMPIVIWVRLIIASYFLPFVSFLFLWQQLPLLRSAALLLALECLDASWSWWQCPLWPFAIQELVPTTSSSTCIPYHAVVLISSSLRHTQIWNGLQLQL